MQFGRGLGPWLASAASAALLAGVPSALAQPAPVVSRPVVQSLPSADSRRLSAALARIARNPRDVSALIEAGDAATAMGDAEAAAGFYKRADEIAPANPRVKAGIARALVLQGDPIKAIPLFAQAEAGGAATDVTADRGLAYDLVGDTVTAQGYYRTALAQRDDDEVRRRLGISLAIAGEAAASEAMLMPLLRKQDKPGWRSHAFALAIAGRTKEAVETVNAILPGPLAQSVTPYLRYMARLTKAQQAAAANLGKFPRASEIGRDDPAIAAYAPSGTRLASVGAGLIPQGKALGSGRTRVAAAQEPAPLSRSERRARERASRLAQAEAKSAARVAPPEPMPTIDRGTGELPPVASSPRVAASVAPSPAPAPAPAPAPSPTPAPVPTPPATRVAALGTVEQGEAVAPVARTPSAAPGGGFDLARLPSSSPNVPSSAQPNAAPDGPPPSPASLEQIFADLGAPSGTAAPVAGAVDIRSIVPAKPEPEVVKPAPVTEAEAKRAETAKTPPTVEKKGKEAAAVKGGAGKKAEDGKAASAKAEEAKLAEAKKLDPKKAAAAKKAEAKKAPPSHPSRIWVQIGVGRDKAAIAFDWRKYLRENPAAFKGKQPYISDMGRTNRMLVGPFESQKAAAAYLAQLKKAGVDRGFVWTSPAGQVVDALSAK